jgi:NhaB family Na+:H+ antiporter
MAHISMPVLVVGLITCALLEITGKFGYGTLLNDKVRAVLEEYDYEMSEARTREQWMAIIVQGAVALVLVFALALHLAEPGIVGLLVIVLATAFNGVTEEHRIGHAFEEATRACSPRSFTGSWTTTARPRWRSFISRTACFR